MSLAIPGWHSKQDTGTFPCNDTGWSVPNSSAALSSPQSHPDGWPQLGAGQDPVPSKLDSSPQLNQGFLNNIMPQQPEQTGWGAPISSNSTPTSGWGMPPPAPQGAGWGGAASSGGSSWPRQPQVDNGTALWGKQNQTGSGWSMPPSSQPPASQSSWNSIPPPATTSSAPQVPGQEEKSAHPVVPNSSSGAPSSQPESWAAAAAASPAQSQPGQSQPPANTAKQPPGGNDTENLEPKVQHQEVDRVESEEPTIQAQPSDPAQNLVNSHEGWGKRPIQQNTTWDVSDSPSYSGQPPVKTGTEAWGKAPPGKPAPGWQGPSGGPPDPSTQQQWSKPAGNPPIRGWGPMTPQTQMPPRPPWGGQPNNPPPQAGWGDPRLPSPSTTIHTNRWNAPPNNPMPSSGNQGWGAPNVQVTGWKNSATSSDNSGWGNNVQRNPPTSNWSAPPPRPEGGWNPPQNIQRPGMVDDGTSAWGDPTAYKNVNLWDKKSSGAPMGAGDAGHAKPETTGWGAPHVPQGLNNKPSPTAWGDLNPNKPANEGTASWGKQSQRGSNWDQGQGGGIGKPDNSNGWGGNIETSNSQWGQPDNDLSRMKNQDFGFMDRKPSASMDNVFDDGPLDRNLNGMGGDIGGPGGVNYGQFSVASNNSAMANLNGSRPMPPQNMMGMPGQYRQAPPQPPGQLQNQLQQLRQAVVTGMIPPQLLHPQIMTPQHISHLQQFIAKTNECQQLSSRMNLINKQQNMPPHIRSQQLDQCARMLRQLQQQIQNIQRVLAQNSMQKSGPPALDKSSLGRGTGMGPDLHSSSGPMAPMNSNMSPFNMSSMSQGLPNTGGNSMNREQQSRLHSWRRPSAGFDGPAPLGLGGGMPTSISDMIGGGPGLLNSFAELGGPLGLRQPGNGRGTGGDQNNGANDFGNRQMQNNDDPATDPEQEASNLKNILADIGPPEFIPGKKWAGFQPIDPENDPDITPGSVAIAKTMSVNTVKDADQVLNRDRYTASQQDTTAPNSVNISAKTHTALASSFASDNPNSAMPPPSWGTGSQRWSDNGKMWLVLSNISSQMDPNTLRNLCSMSGKVVSFQANLPVRGMVLVKYQTSEEALMAKNKLTMSFAGTNMLSASNASEQEIANFINNSGGNWNPGSSGRQLFGSVGGPPNNHPQGPRSFGGPMMPNSDLPYSGGGDAQNLWSTADSGMPPPQATAPWSTGVNHAPARNMNLWNNGPFENPRVMSPHNLLPENLLGEHTL